MNYQRTHIAELDCIVAKDANIETPKALVVLCHGFGAPSTDLVGFATELVSADEKLNEAVYVFPGAPIVLEPGFDSRAWWMIDIERLQKLRANGEERKLKESSPEELPQRRQQLSAIIDHFRKLYDLAANKVCVGGFSQGSMLATDTALHYPEAMGGLIVWSGSLINQAAWQPAAESIDKLSVVQSHGTLDEILPHSGAEALRDMLTSAGHEVQFISFRGPHTINQEAIQAAAGLIGGML